MAVWLVRAGSEGEYEQRFIEDSRVYLTWGLLDVRLDSMSDRSELIEHMGKLYGDEKPKRLINYASQIWPFAHTMEEGDMVVLPSKQQPVIHIGRITSGYQHDANAKDPFYHWRNVSWRENPVHKSHFSQDLLYSFGAFMTICRITRNNAESRLAQMEANGWQAETIKQIVNAHNDSGEQDEEHLENIAEADLEELAHNQIIRLIEAKFKGHNLTRLVKAILEAQGYTCWQSPQGADGGVDILAGNGPMGFGEQRICVEVKSGDELIDRPTVDKLMGAMTKFNASQGIFVSWGGYKSNVQKELATSFFRMRLWSQQDLLEQLFSFYDKLDEEIKAEIPLKRVWSLAQVE